MKNSEIESEFPDCITCDIKNHSVLQKATPETINKINSMKRFYGFQKGEYLFHTGDRASGFFFIRTGSVRNFKVSTSGKEQTFQILGPGDWVGFRDSMSGEIFNHSAICLEETSACFISRELADLLIQDDAKFQTEVFVQMAKEWRASEEQCVSLGTKQVHSKLAELLITLKTAAGDGNEIELKMTRDVLASIIGTTTETLVRALTDFKNRNIIQVEKNKLIFQDMKTLHTMSEMEQTPHL
ncbi:Crp/Fnr family transcriptional regulator [Leptospira sp. GIMC2001]|uniref:Crp/Fnr family transcriptional regulator n=1 Tax=Leptospira sp. GIMC2001 TaxID=1513297 RepID=UPI0023490C8A|nr:Crp/Fnr family transcriptional regulator [Leptospira sp. GIMC2001]WCL48858.1 Crp/Fnr family transcriptional regulator [Leptospira sp. GIMC2001]